MTYLAAAKSRPLVHSPSRNLTAPLGSARVPNASRPRLLPPHPAAIPIHPKLEIEPAASPFEREAENMAARTSGLAAPAGRGSSVTRDAPPAVYEALDSPGRPLDPAVRSAMESRLGGDFADIRVHTGSPSQAAARTIQSRAYTVGQDIFFDAAAYNPHSVEGRRLLAHELSHTLQQSGAGGLSHAPLSVQRDPVPTVSPGAGQGTSTDTETKKPKTDQVTVQLPAPLLQRYRLTPPSLLTPPQGPYLPPAYQYTPPTPGPQVPSLPPASPGSGSAGTTTTPKTPDRLSLHDFGNFSIGARINFPDLSKDAKPGDPPSAAQEAMKKGEILNFMITGQPPSEYSLDAGKLVSAVWGIFSTQIAPSAAAKIASAMASKPAGGGPSYQLDVTMLYSSVQGRTSAGAGATLTVNF